MIKVNNQNHDCMIDGNALEIRSDPVSSWVSTETRDVIWEYAIVAMTRYHLTIIIVFFIHI